MSLFFSLIVSLKSVEHLECNEVSKRVKGTQWESMCVSRVYEGCFKEVSRKFQGCFKGVSRKFPGYFKKVSRVLQECFTVFTKFLRCFKQVLRRFQEGFEEV